MGKLPQTTPKKTPVTPNVGGSTIVVYDRLDSGLVTLVDHNAEVDEAADNKAAEDAGEEEDEKEGEKTRVSWWSRVGGRAKRQRQRQREVEGFRAIVKRSFSGRGVPLTG